LLNFQGRWGVPSGRIPTTHILKPPTAEFDGHAENEHFCLRLANSLDLPTAYSEVRFFEDEVAIVVERYDRIVPLQSSNHLNILRVHQEDMCQASGLLPIFKYQNEGGPSPEDILEILAIHSSRPEVDCAVFIDALAFNWLIAGTDAHAKNYSILYDGEGGDIRLAPLYDIASALPYEGKLDLQQIKLAMKVGGEYRLRDIGIRQWQKFAAAVPAPFKADVILERLRHWCEIIPDLAMQTRDRIHAQGLTHALIPRLADAVAARAAACAKALKP
jgi:serine/threonine-protein kinase HipA